MNPAHGRIMGFMDLSFAANNIVFAITVLIFVLMGSGMALLESRREHQERNAEIAEQSLKTLEIRLAAREKENERLYRSVESLEEDLRLWKAGFERRVEERVRKEISEWTPSEEDAEADFRKAEIMAEKRVNLDAGRLHPPRDDAGPSARLSRITFRG